MRSLVRTSLILLVCALLAVPVLLETRQQRTRPEPPKLTKAEKRRATIERKAGRADYFFRMLRDPRTNSIPARIRERELAYARTLPTIESLSAKAGSAEASIAWQEAGPNNVGGRTRALAVDVTNSDVVLAGGVSGGIWKSTDRGATWTMKSDPSQHPSVTWLAQDPRAGQTNVWYASTGEFSGSMDDQGGRAKYFGGGLFKSSDGGETWTQIQGAGSPVEQDTAFDFVSKVMVHPATGTVFLSSNNRGLYRSTDAGQSFSRVFGSTNDHSWIGLDIAANGTIVMVASDGANFPPQQEAGVYRSTDDGQNWTAITPSTFPLTQDRSVVAIAPSNPDVAYVFTWTGLGQGEDEDVRFHRITISSGEAEDRSANLPKFGGKVGFVDTQNAYNMTIVVKPDDENFVLFGATNLYRSRDGFGTVADDLTENWIGGYATANDVSDYPNQHPDQHVLVFDPNDSNRLWAGHDGGVGMVDDIRTTADLIPWQSKSNTYNVTQFYAVAIHKAANDTRIVGGTQDNGTPFFRSVEQGTASSIDVSGGDGGYAYLGDTFAYVSTQEGRIRRHTLQVNGTIDKENGDFSDIEPTDASGQLFVTPFVVDPSNEDIMYYLAGNTLWRNDGLSSIPDFEPGTMVGWTELTSLQAPDGYTMSTLAVSQAPAHVLYYAASSTNGPPLLFRLDNANTSTSGATAIPIPDATSGAYVHSIAVNPNDANEILVAFSNYNVVGLFHSTDGGQNYTPVEGNLTGNATNPGPSLRSVSILPLSGEIVYLVGTSIGAYSTSVLSGGNTVWLQQAASTLGNIIIAQIASRPSDGRVALGTHGRGIFVGAATPGGSNAAPIFTAALPETATVVAGTELAFIFTATDADGDALTFSLVNPPTGATIDPATGAFSWTPTAAQVGTQTITVQVSDGTLTATAQTSVTVTAANAAPTFTAVLPDTTVAVGTTLAFTYEATDPNGDAVTFSLTGPAGISLDATTGAFSWTPTTGQVGTQTIAVTASDGALSTTTQATVTVVAPNQAPTFTSAPANVSLAPGDTLRIQYAATDADGDVLSFSLLDGPSTAVLDTQTGLLTWASDPNASGTFTFRIEVSDGTLTAVAETVVTITLANVAPVFTVVLGDTTVAAGQALAFTYLAVDTDGDPVSYALVDPPDGATLDSNTGVLTWTPTQDQEGEHVITVEARDALLTAQTTATVTVTFVNQAPAFSATLPDTAITTGTTLTFTYQAADPDGDAVFYEMLEGPNNATLDEDSGVLTWAPTAEQVGSQRIEVEAHDGDLGVITAATVTVTSGVGNEALEQPDDFALRQNYPNPFNPSTTITFVLLEASHVSLAVFDMNGRKVRDLVVGETKSAGRHTVVFDAGRLASGTYGYTLRAESTVGSGKTFVRTMYMALVK